MADQYVIPTTDGGWRAYCALGDGWVSDSFPAETDAHAAKLIHRRLSHGGRERWVWWQGRWYRCKADGTWDLDVPEADVPEYIREKPRGDPGTY
jgi:hypothetical protein